MIISRAMTSHAEERRQQRAIPFHVIELLHRFGSSFRCRGADRLIFDSAARRRLRSHLGRTRDLRPVERWLRVYLVVGDDGQVVTVGYRTKRMWRP
jgi:hypothetical protein